VQIDTHPYADTLVATPHGRIDHRSAAELEAALTPWLESGRVHSLVIDLSGVEYISSVGLRVLMIAAKKLREQHARLAVAALQSVVTEIFVISRFDRILEVHTTLDAALARSSAEAQTAFRAAHPSRSQSAPP
jgi:anti-sigma B factor antagonist/stage II sporulation protein AA (anti-sigma F factor antagonist)